MTHRNARLTRDSRRVGRTGVVRMASGRAPEEYLAHRRLLEPKAQAKVMAVNRIGTSSNKITCRPFTSIAVALERITSPPGSPGSVAVTDAPS